MRRVALLLLIALRLAGAQATAQSLVAGTPPLTPAEERAKFHLPPGFEIQLVAEEPAIHKPMNLKFDAHGRLWVTHSLEYPFPATSDDTARDALDILSDFAPDGKARKIVRFADHLNIPIGVLPLSDREAFAWSIPNIYRFKDTNGDGRADEKTIAFGPFGVVDTHGDQNAFTRWIDGWIYANHGFSNDSHVKIVGQGPDVLHMNSGNTYRFRPDGKSIEQYSWGQVNPFGLSFDPLGNLFSADCHSCAVTMLLREGHYQSFGKPHDGLGFAPEITHIDHGGTGIAGVVYSVSPNFPPEYRDVLFVGNVITNRIHCDRLEWRGSTPVVTKVENFITCDDPWFRPVDMQPGPDGALYIADFYNCIIGHYEVPLTHPKRDRERGRIWRIVYTGKGVDKAPEIPVVAMPDLPSQDAKSLFALLKHANLTVRVLATNLMVDRFSNESAKLAANLLSHELPTGANDANNSPDAWQASHAVWLLQRTAGMSQAIAARLMSVNSPPIVQVHAAKALGETTEWEPWHFEIVRAALENADPFVRRAAAEALAKHPAAENIAPLLTMLDATDQTDAQLYHQVRIALRDQLRSTDLADRLTSLPLSPDQKKKLLVFAASAPTGPAAMLIFDEALHGRVSNDLLVQALPEAARYVDAPRVDAMIENIQKRFPKNTPRQLSLLRSLAEGMSQRGLPLTQSLQGNLTRLIGESLATDSSSSWYNIPPLGGANSASPWAPERRAYTDGSSLNFISSLPGGERGGGTLRSPVFDLPPQLKFWMCGHNGIPNQPDRQQNFVRLVSETGAEIARSYPPRDDIARPFTWDTAGHAGERAHIEVVDGVTDLDGFAWIAVSLFEPGVISIPDQPVGELSAVRAALYRLAGQFKLTGLVEQVATAAAPTNADLTTRLSANEAFVTLDPERAVPLLSTLINSSDLPTPTRDAAAGQLARIDRPNARDALVAGLKSAPQPVATTIAAALAGNPSSAEALLAEIRQGRASAALLREPTVIDRLKSSALPNLEQQVAELTVDLSPADDRIAKLITDRRAGFLAGQFDPEAGRAVFAKSVCASCHQIGGVGKSLGPALDGIGNRGLDRLLEDTLDPNRNVDLAFRTVTVETTSGQLLVGFGLREEGQTLAFSDANGQPQTLPLSEVADRTPSSLSPMPGNVIEQIPEQDYYSLLAYLLSLKGK